MKQNTFHKIWANHRFYSAFANAGLLVVENMSFNQPRILGSLSCFQKLHV